MKKIQYFFVDKKVEKKQEYIFKIFKNIFLNKINNKNNILYLNIWYI